MKKLVSPWFLVAYLLSGNFAFSLADTYEVNIPGCVTIQNGNGAFRALLDFALPEGFADFDIEIARLVIPFGPIGEEVEFQLFPVSTYWTPDNVSWDYPWSIPGGDYDDSLSVNMYVLNGDNLIAEDANFTVTEALILMQDGIDYYGFILIPPPYEELGFDSHLITTFDEVSGMKLEIYTR